MRGNMQKPLSTPILNPRPRCLCVNLAGMGKRWADTLSLRRFEVLLAGTRRTNRVQELE